MNREIKFRAYDKDKKIMIHEYDQLTGKIYNLPLGSSIRDFVFNLGLSYETLMQYTGLKDKNGKDIYEGDILNYYTGTVVVKFGVFDNGAFYDSDVERGVGFYLEDTENVRGFDEWYANNSEVIGNIYENPELLNATKEDE